LEVGRRADSQTTLEVGELVHSIGKSADAELNKPFDQYSAVVGELFVMGQQRIGHANRELPFAGFIPLGFGCTGAG
jgi:hypothetical protein